MTRRPGSSFYVLLLGLTGSALLASMPGTPAVPHQSQAGREAFSVGFRVDTLRDRSRTLGPSSDFEGRRHEAPREWPVQVAVWYPAVRADGSGLRDGEYRAWHYVRESLADPSPDDERRAADDLRSLATAARLPLSHGDVEAALAVRGIAVRNAPPAPGRFPVVIGGLGGPGVAWPLAERLARHGYVVATASTLARTMRAEATRPLIALEERARTLEFLVSHLAGASNVDLDYMALAGVNFDGAAALLSQARTMRARAVVSIDGREGKAGGTALLEGAPEFDLVRLRAPYLTVQWDEPTLAAPDPALFERLVYAPRRWLVIRGLGHAHLVGNVVALPGLAPDVRRAVDLLHESIRGFLDEHVKGQARDEVAPASLLRVDERRPALPPAPTPDEVESLLWTRADVDRGLAVIRTLQATHPAGLILDAATARLYAFRHERAGRHAAADALRKYADEVTPR
jgi:hypothetical protein